MKIAIVSNCPNYQDGPKTMITVLGLVVYARAPSTALTHTAAIAA